MSTMLDNLPPWAQWGVFAAIVLFVLTLVIALAHVLWPRLQ